jgi:proteasome activator subunit 4
LYWQNAGSSSAASATFIWALTAVFVTRWKEEERPSCKTPRHRRLTPEMKREFSVALRTVALLSMFSKAGL